MIIIQILAISLVHFLLKGWENGFFELRSERVNETNTLTTRLHDTCPQSKQPHSKCTKDAAVSNIAKNIRHPPVHMVCKTHLQYQTFFSISDFVSKYFRPTNLHLVFPHHSSVSEPLLLLVLLSPWEIYGLRQMHRSKNVELLYCVHAMVRYGTVCRWSLENSSSRVMFNSGWQIGKTFWCFEVSPLLSAKNKLVHHLPNTVCQHNITGVTGQCTNHNFSPSFCCGFFVFFSFFFFFWGKSLILPWYQPHNYCIPTTYLHHSVDYIPTMYCINHLRTMFQSHYHTVHATNHIPTTNINHVTDYSTYRPCYQLHCTVDIVNIVNFALRLKNMLFAKFTPAPLFNVDHSSWHYGHFMSGHCAGGGGGGCFTWGWDIPKFGKHGQVW